MRLLWGTVDSNPAPWEKFNRVWWLPLAVDLGCLPYLLLAFGFVALEWTRRQQPVTWRQR
jgi:hypothetical protein